MLTGLWRRLTQRSIRKDLQSDLGRGRDSVVGVGHEARVHAALESLTGGVEGRLGDGVVHGVELEDDGVANRYVVQLIRREDQAGRSAHSDGMAGGSRRYGSHSGIASASGDGLGDGDLVVDRRRFGVVARVDPDDDDLGLGVDVNGEAVAAVVLGAVAAVLSAVLSTVAALAAIVVTLVARPDLQLGSRAAPEGRVAVADGAGQSQGR